MHLYNCVFRFLCIYVFVQYDGAHVKLPVYIIVCVKLSANNAIEMNINHKTTSHNYKVFLDNNSNVNRNITLVTVIILKDIYYNSLTDNLTISKINYL